MALDNTARQTFEVLKHVAINGDLALMECADVDTGEVVAVLCAVNRGVEYEMVPLGRLFNGNPYEGLLSPLQIDEFKAQQATGYKTAKEWLANQEWVGTND